MTEEDKAKLLKSIVEKALQQEFGHVPKRKVNIDQRKAENGMGTILSVGGIGDIGLITKQSNGLYRIEDILGTFPYYEDEKEAHLYGELLKWLDHYMKPKAVN